MNLLFNYSHLVENRSTTHSYHVLMQCIACGILIYNFYIYLRIFMPTKVLHVFIKIFKRYQGTAHDEPLPYRLEHENEYSPLIS